MAKMFFSLGFWMTIVLFVALGYAFGYANSADCPGPMNCAFASWASRDQNPGLENEPLTSDVSSRSECPPDAATRENDLSFRQFANLQAGQSTYAPGLSLTITRRGDRDRLNICPGPIEIPPHY
jgi:hypothetical protein